MLTPFHLPTCSIAIGKLVFVKRFKPVAVIVKGLSLRRDLDRKLELLQKPPVVLANLPHKGVGNDPSTLTTKPESLLSLEYSKSPALSPSQISFLSCAALLTTSVVAKAISSATAPIVRLLCTQIRVHYRSWSVKKTRDVVLSPACKNGLESWLEQKRSKP